MAGKKRYEIDYRVDLTVKIVVHALDEDEALDIAMDKWDDAVTYDKNISFVREDNIEYKILEVD